MPPSPPPSPPKSQQQADSVDSSEPVGYAHVMQPAATNGISSREPKSPAAREEYSEATFDSIEPSENKLNHPTANRVRPPMNRRPPSHINVVKENGNEPNEQQPAWMKDLGKRNQAKFSSQPAFETKDVKMSPETETALPRGLPQKSPPASQRTPISLNREGEGFSVWC